MLIVVKLKELICKCVITHQRQRREGANYETGALGVKLCPGHATKLFLGAEKQEGTEDTNHIKKKRDASELSCKNVNFTSVKVDILDVKKDSTPFIILIKFFW